MRLYLTFECPFCHATVPHIGSNPNRPNGPWHRCWWCGALWDNDENDLLIAMPDLKLAPEALDSYAT